MLYITKIVNNIFRTKIEAELFARMLCSGIVTPITLADVVEDHMKAGLA